MHWKQLLASITGSVDEELRLRNAYLTAENRILRHQITGRVPLTNAERTTLAELGQKLGKKALAEVATIAQPDTSLAWHRQLVDQSVDTLPCTSVGRPRIGQEIEDVVVRMARENRSWGYDRIAGAVANLGYRISDQTVGNILKRHDILPAPERTKTMTWREFIRIHMAMLGATEFFSSAVWASLSLLVASILCFLYFGLCKGYVVGRTFLCYGGWRQRLAAWSPDGQRDAEKRGELVRAEAPSQRMLCGAWVIKPLLCLSKTPHARAPLLQGLGRGGSCLWRIAIRDGMAPSEVDNGAAGYAGMTGARPHEDVSYSTRDNATKHAPRKQSRGRSARKRIVWKRKPM